MSRIKGFLVFVYDFVVGDDWRMSVAVMLGLVATALAVRWGFAAWLPLPVFVAAGLALSLRRAIARD